MVRSFVAAICMVVVMATQAAAQLALDMRNIELRDFVEIVSDTLGRNFILDQRVRGTVDVYAPSTISDDALYEIFLNVLELNKLTIVEGDEVDRIVPLGLARELSSDGWVRAGRDGYETRVLEVSNLTVQEAVEIITPLLPPESVLSTLPSAGLLILSDSRQNHERIKRILLRVDQQRDNGVETIRLQNGNAADLLVTLQNLNMTPPGASLSADARGEAIVVNGSQEFRMQIRTLIRQLDTPRRSLRTAVVKLNYSKATELRDVVAGSFGAGSASDDGSGKPSDVTVFADGQSNALVITAPVDRLPSIVSSIHALDSRPRQVLIEAVIFELSVENFSDLSVQFGAILDDAIGGGVEFNLPGRPTLTSAISAAVAGTRISPGSGGTIGVRKKANSNGDSFAGFLSAIVSQTSTRLLSTPSIIALHNTEAEILVAQKVPFVTGSYSTVGDSAVPDQPFQTIDRENVGLTLRVLPQITNENTVRLEISQEVSSLTNAASAAGGEITAQRNLTTNVLVRDGRVIMLGGLLENGSGSINQKVPGLGDLPLLGGLFRGRNVSESQKVLLVLLRPRIIDSDKEATQLSRELAREARNASLTLAPKGDKRFPQVPPMAFPFDGVDLNQPFELDIMDPIAVGRFYPRLPKPLKFE